MGNANRVSQWVKYCACLYVQLNFQGIGFFWLGLVLIMIEVCRREI